MSKFTAPLLLQVPSFMVMGRFKRDHVHADRWMMGSHGVKGGPGILGESHTRVQIR
jgi:hypothetical protein